MSHGNSPTEPLVAVVAPDLDLGQVPCRLELWLVRRGQRVTAGDRIAELLAGDVLVDVPAPANGRLVRKAVAEQAPVRAGDLLGWIETE